MQPHSTCCSCCPMRSELHHTVGPPCMCRTQAARWDSSGLTAAQPHHTTTTTRHFSPHLSPEQVLTFFELFELQFSNCLGTMDVLAKQAMQYAQLLSEMTGQPLWFSTPLHLNPLLREVDISLAKFHVLQENLYKEVETRKTALRSLINHETAARDHLTQTGSVAQVQTVLPIWPLSTLPQQQVSLPSQPMPIFYSAPCVKSVPLPSQQSEESTKIILTPSPSCHQDNSEKNDEQVEPIDLSIAKSYSEEIQCESSSEEVLEEINVTTDDSIIGNPAESSCAGNESPVVSSPVVNLKPVSVELSDEETFVFGRPPKRWPCLEESCPKKFDSRSLRDVHHRIHTGARPFNCPHCPRAFRQLGQVQKHVKSIHTRQLEFTCDQCPRAFVDRTSLQYHILARHRPTSERPFGCDLCPKRFITQNDVRRHVICCHSGRGQFKCDDCDRVFHLFCHLNEHRKKHEAAPYQCRFCSNTFRNLNRLETHEALKHRA